ncbi:nicolin-1 isoform X2 [Protopterus annectens]|nr:nicolin-1 isoform X2 [Protopterus annectens]XP_043926508.1 nicolin-1 isoform X2 [Protopterus annectens]XP_043926509.1 nicolin-1 isoform X2 [Protopterus annectens]
MCDSGVVCTVKPPVALQIGDVKTDVARPGVFAIDISFLQTICINEILFKNYYTAYVTVRIQKRQVQESGQSQLKWYTCLRDHCLMSDPHTEEGSQDYFSIFRHQMSCKPDDVVGVRLILRQPSPVWINFTIEDIKIYQLGSENSQLGVHSVISHLPTMEKSVQSEEGLPDSEKVSSHVQQMWALTAMMQANQTTARIGRFDIDGCYDVNLLSYT